MRLLRSDCLANFSVLKVVAKPYALVNKFFILQLNIYFFKSIYLRSNNA